MWSPIGTLWEELNQVDSKTEQQDLFLNTEPPLQENSNPTQNLNSKSPKKIPIVVRPKQKIIQIVPTQIMQNIVPPIIPISLTKKPREIVDKDVQIVSSFPKASGDEEYPWLSTTLINVFDPKIFVFRNFMFKTKYHTNCQLILRRDHAMILSGTYFMQFRPEIYENLDKTSSEHQMEINDLGKLKKKVIPIKINLEKRGFEIDLFSFHGKTSKNYLVLKFTFQMNVGTLKTQSLPFIHRTDQSMLLSKMKDFKGLKKL